MRQRRRKCNPREMGGGGGNKGAEPDAAQPGAGEKTERLAASAALTKLRHLSFHVLPEVCQMKAWRDIDELIARRSITVRWLGRAASPPPTLLRQIHERDKL